MRILLFPSCPIIIRESWLISESLSRHKSILHLSAFTTALPHWWLQRNSKFRFPLLLWCTWIYLCIAFYRTLNFTEKYKNDRKCHCLNTYETNCTMMSSLQVCWILPKCSKKSLHTLIMLYCDYSEVSVNRNVHIFVFCHETRSYYNFIYTMLNLFQISRLLKTCSYMLGKHSESGNKVFFFVSG